MARMAAGRFFVVLNGDTRRDEIEPQWHELAEGTIIQALTPAEFSPAYGMFTDRYGAPDLRRHVVTATSPS